MNGHQSPRGSFACFDVFSAEIAANTKRLGFLEPEHDVPYVAMNGYEMQLGHMFRNLLTPYSKACEAIRKGDFAAAETALEDLSHNASAHRKHMKESKDRTNVIAEYDVTTQQDRSLALHSKLALIPTELTEIYLNNDNLDDLGDAIIRAMSIAGAMHFSLDEAITREMANNATRQPKHGKKA